MIHNVTMQKAGNPKEGTSSKGTIITVNGWTCDQNFWRKQTPFIGERYDLAGFDVKGYAEGGNFATLAREVVQMCRDRRIGNPHLLVHSMGGLTGIAYLHLVKEPGYEDVRPRSIAFVTPVLDDPRKTLPAGGWLVNFASAFTRWRVNRILKSIERQGRPGERNEQTSYRRLLNTFTAFQAASPGLIWFLGGPREARKEFSDFLKSAKKADRATTLMGLHAMCTEGPALNKILLDGDIFIPPKVLVVGGPHDIFVDAKKVEDIASSAFGRKTTLTMVRMASGGHFPFLEDPAGFNDAVGMFLSGSLDAYKANFADKRDISTAGAAGQG